MVSCKKKEDQLVKNYYSCGVINTEVISYTSTKAVVKVRFFILDKSNNDGLIRQNILNKIMPHDSDYTGTYILDSLKIITTPNKGNYSAAVLISDGFDDKMNMGDYFFAMEPTVRKFLHTSVPDNEVMLAKIGNKAKPLEIINSGFTRNANELDLSLAEVCKKGDYITSDSLPLLESIDSIINYLNVKSTYSNKNLIILCSRRKYFLQKMNFDSIINKAKQSNITVHMLELVPEYTWTNFSLQKFLFKLNTYTNGVYYAADMYAGYSYNDGELPMSMLQVSGKLNEMIKGNYECFEAVWTLNSNSSEYNSGTIYSSGFKVKLSTNYEQQEIDIPFNFYINP